MTPTLKPGILTSEFWITLAVLVLPLINHYLDTQFTPDQAANLVVSVVSVVGSVVAAVTYIVGRVKLKNKGSV